MYQRAISTLGCPDFSLEETRALAQRHGLDAVELRALGGTIDLPAYFAQAYGSPAAMADRIAREPGPRIASLDTSLKLAGSNAADREAFLQFLPWAEHLGVRWLRVFDGGHAADLATHREMAETVAWWRGLRAKNGWKADIMVETHDALHSARAIHDFLREAPGTAILWDTHHTWHKGGEEPVATWNAIKPFVVHVHVKDSIAKPSAKHAFTYVLPGDGLFPARPLIAALKNDFNGVVSLEWELLWHPYLPPVADALAAAAKCKWW